jgi:hypothetical protein
MRLMLVPAILAGLLLSAAPVAAQPGGKKGSKVTNSEDIVTYMFSFNKKKDGKLTKEELTDKRLHRLFDLADTDKDGVVTKAELTALVEKMAQEEKKGGGPGGPGGFGPGPGGPGGGKFGPPGGGPSQTGQIIPTFLRTKLNLTKDQEKQLDALQKEVDAKLSKILTEEQLKQLKSPPKFGPGGPGGPPGKGPGAKGPPETSFQPVDRQFLIVFVACRFENV